MLFPTNWVSLYDSVRLTVIWDHYTIVHESMKFAVCTLDLKINYFKTTLVCWFWFYSVFYGKSVGKEYDTSYKEVHTYASYRY